MRRRDGSPTGDQMRLGVQWNTGNTIRQDTAAMAVRQWREIGVDAADRPTEWSVMLDDLTLSRFDVVIIGWALGLDPDPFPFFHSSQAVRTGGHIRGFNRQPFINAEVDRLLEAGRLTVDVAERRAMYQQVDQILNRELPYIWLWQRTLVRGVSNRVSGIIESPIGTIIGEARFLTR